MPDIPIPLENMDFPGTNPVWSRNRSLFEFGEKMRKINKQGTKFAKAHFLLLTVYITNITEYQGLVLLV